MYFRILINTVNQEYVQAFRDRLLAELLDAGEQESNVGGRSLPLAYPDHLDGLRSYYISGHQHQLSEAELEALVDNIYVEVFGTRQNFQFRVLVHDG